MITGEHFLSHTAPVFGSLKSMKVCDIHKYLVALYVFSHKSLFIRIRHNPYTTFENSSIVPHFRRLSVTQRSLCYCAPQIWNLLPDTIKDFLEYSELKKRLKNISLTFINEQIAYDELHLFWVNFNERFISYRILRYSVYDYYNLPNPGGVVWWVISMG